MSQSRKHSAIEAVANVAVGYGISVGAQMVIFPAFGIHTSLRDDLLIGAAFTVVSLARSYALRRLFNRAATPEPVDLSDYVPKAALPELVGLAFRQGYVTAQQGIEIECDCPDCQAVKTRH